MTARDLLHRLWTCGVTVRADGGQLRLSPAEAVPTHLIGDLRRHKSELLTLLSCDEPVSQADRERVYADAVAEANRCYRGRPINWSAVDDAAERMLAAQTCQELQSAARDYVQAVANNAANRGQGRLNTNS